MDFSTVVRASRRQFLEPKYPLDTKIMMACEASMYSSSASMDSRSSTSRKIEAPGRSSESWRLMVAH